MRTKLKWPITGMIASVLGLIYYKTPELAFLLAGWAGAALETLAGIIILVALMSEREFSYESWMGWLLNQYIISTDVSITDIITLICARIFCFILIIFPPVWGTLWILLPVTLYLVFTCIHIVDDPPTE